MKSIIQFEIGNGGSEESSGGFTQREGKTLIFTKSTTAGKF
jgi:hypothetical protein